MKKDNGIIQIRPDKKTGEQPKKRANEMALDDGRSLSGFIKWLINKEWKKRNKE